MQCRDIDAILAERTQRRQLGSRAGNTFSTATFAAEEAHVRTYLLVSIGSLSQMQPVSAPVSREGCFAASCWPCA